MTQSQAERVANVVIGAAALGAAYYILRTPPLRRLAWGLARTAFTAAGPGWLATEVKRGWDASAATGQAQPPGI